MHIDISAQATKCDLSNLDLIFKEIGLKVPVDKIELVKIQIDPENTGVFTYEQLLTWLENDHNKGYFSITRTIKNVYGYLFKSKEKKFKQNSKELILLAAQKQAKILLQSYTVIDSLKNSPGASAPFNPTSMTSKVKSNTNPHPNPHTNSHINPHTNPHSNPQSKPNFNPHSNPHSNIQPNPHISSNKHSTSHLKLNSYPNPHIYSNPHFNPHSNPYPTRNPDKPYDMATKNIDLQLFEMSLLEAIGELKLVRKVNQDDMNIKNKWFYVRLVNIYIINIYVYTYMYIHTYK
jgi:hypothetical protein